MSEDGAIRSRGRRGGRGVRLGALLALWAGLAATFCGCGIDFGGGSDGTELFADLTIEGEQVEGKEITVQLDYTQVYPVDVDVRCWLEQDGRKVKVIGDGTIPPNPEGEPEATPTPGTLTFQFTAHGAGKYWVVCRTPADENNAIGEPLELAPETEP